MQACIMVLIAYLNGFEDSWLASLTWEDFTAVSAPYQWYCAVYWVITTVRGPPASMRVWCFVSHIISCAQATSCLVVKASLWDFSLLH